MKKKLSKEAYDKRKRTARLLHLLQRFSTRLKMDVSLADLDNMLQQINTDKEKCFLATGNVWYVGIYKVNLRGYDIIVISDHKNIFTTYGYFKGSRFDKKEEKTDAPTKEY